MTYTVDQIKEGFPLTWVMLEKLYPPHVTHKTFLGKLLYPLEPVKRGCSLAEILSNGAYKDPVFYICESLLAGEGWRVKKWERSVITDGTVTLTKGNPGRILLCDGNDWVTWLSKEEHSLLRLCYDSHINKTLYPDVEAIGRTRLTEIYTKGEGSQADEN